MNGMLNKIHSVPDILGDCGHFGQIFAFSLFNQLSNNYTPPE